MKPMRNIQISGGSVLLCTFMLAVPGLMEARSDNAVDPSADVTVIHHCLIDYDHNTTLSSSIASILQDCLVEPGSKVKAGQLLGRLQDEDLRIESRVRESVASSDIDLRLSKAKSALAQNKLQRTAVLTRKSAVSQEEYQQHRLEAEAASLEVEQARQRHELAQLQLEQTRAALKARELVSPHNGVVVNVARRKGEAVAPHEPIFQVVETEHLRVIGEVDLADVARLRIGQKVRVIPEVAGSDLPFEHEVFHGELVFIDSRIDPMSRTCKIHVRTQNRNELLRAGLEARIEIDPEPTVQSSASPNPPPRSNSQVRAGR